LSVVCLLTVLVAKNVLPDTKGQLLPDDQVKDVKLMVPGHESDVLTKLCV